MFKARLRQIGDDLIIVIPRREVERLGLRKGQPVSLEIRKVDGRPILSEDLRRAFDEELPESRTALRYLADR